MLVFPYSFNSHHFMLKLFGLTCFGCDLKSKWISFLLNAAWQKASTSAIGSLRNQDQGKTALKKTVTFSRQNQISKAANFKQLTSVPSVLSLVFQMQFKKSFWHHGHVYSNLKSESKSFRCIYSEKVQINKILKIFSIRESGQVHKGCTPGYKLVSLKTYWHL